MKEIEDLCSMNKNILSMISENINDLIAIVDENLNFVYINEKPFNETLGYSKNYLFENKRTLIDLIHPEDLGPYINSSIDCFHLGQTAGTIRVRRSNGSYIYVEYKSKTFTDKDGSLKLLIIGQDITKKHLIKDLETKLVNLIKKIDNKFIELTSTNASTLIQMTNEMKTSHSIVKRLLESLLTDENLSQQQIQNLKDIYSNELKIEKLLEKLDPNKF